MGYLADAVGVSDRNLEALWEALPGKHHPKGCAPPMESNMSIRGGVR